MSVVAQQGGGEEAEETVLEKEELMNSFVGLIDVTISKTVENESNCRITAHHEIQM